MPIPQQLNSINNQGFETLGELDEGHQEWFLENFESFTRSEELERAIYKSVDLLQKGDYGPVEKLIKEAVQISLTRDLGIDYHFDPRGRLMALKNSNGQQKTGWSDLDNSFYGGVSRGELHLFIGASGTGKSLFMQNLALNWIQMGLNGVYITLELSEELTAMRLDSMLCGIASKDIYKNLDDIELRVALDAKKSGRLKIKYMPPQTNTNAIRAYLKELSIKEKFRPDFIMVDYIDLMMPSSAKVDISDYFTKDKLSSEELRQLAVDSKSIMISASQLNRSGFDEPELSAGSIAGGVSKYYTVDSLMGIYTNRTMKDNGVIQLQLLKTRNSGSVGSKIDLQFDNNTLRISDLNGPITTPNVMTGSNVLAQIKNAPKTKEGDKKDLLSGLLNGLNKKGL
jgi:archaellum biogenesis ATPase FlaH